MNRFPKGFLLALEGLDGAGKTTISNLLATQLRQDGFTVIQTKEPGDACIGPTIREIVNTTKAQLNPKAEYLLFAADRAQHVHEIVAPALAKGYIVISDRMADSSIAYQGYGRGLSIEQIALTNAWALAGTLPNLSIYLKISLEEACKRIKNRNEQKTRFEEHQEFLSRVKKGFDKLFETNSIARYTIDGTLHPEKISSMIYQKIIQKKEAQP